MRVVIIGGVAAGMSAASKIKRLKPEYEVVVYEKGGFLSYGACGLPYYVGGFNDDYRKMIARTKEQFEETGVEIHLQHEVFDLDPANKQILVQNNETKEIFKDNYDKLMIATGASPAVLPVPGIDAKGVYFVKTMEDGLMLKSIVTEPSFQSVQDVAIIGGGYIGIEMAEAFIKLGKNVTLIEADKQILSSFEPELAKLATEELEKHGVAVKTGERVSSITGNPVTGITTNRGSYKTDLVICSVGILPATGFLKKSGISMSRNGAIVVDREMRTSIPDVWSAGDCAVCYNKISKENMFLALGTVANKCGRIAGENITGSHTKFTGALGSAAIKVCDIEMARTGLSENDARQLGIDYKTVTVVAKDHPAYYPDPTPITIKLIYHKRTRVLLGAQTAGAKGAVLRLDVFAVAIHNRMTTDELGMTDLVYAPPFAGVWDAIHIACNAAK